MSATDPADNEPYAVLLSGRARRNIRENLPLEVALAAIDEAKHRVEIYSIRHRRDAYRG